MLRRALPLCFLISVASCDGQKDTSAAPSTAPVTSGPLDANDREIIKLQLELAAGEKDPGARTRAVASVLAQIEKGRLPASWTETMFIVSKAKSVPMASKIMWKTLIGKDDIDPLVAATCKQGQLGLENMERVMEEVRPGMKATFEGLVFSQCRMKEIGFLDAPDDLHHAALVFAAVAYHDLSSRKILSEEETRALREFVKSFSAFYRANRILPRDQRVRPKPTSSASATPSAAPSGSVENRGP